MVATAIRVNPAASTNWWTPLSGWRSPGERRHEAEAVGSVGSRGASYDNALAETVNGLSKAELINRHRPWR